VKKTFVIASLLLVLGLSAGIMAYRFECDPALHEAACHGDTMVWLKKEFHLSEKQAADIQKLHLAYSLVCDKHCHDIREAMQARDRLKTSGSAEAPAIAEANARIREQKARCETSLLQHLEQVANLMSPEDGQRYLQMMRPRVCKFDHSGAPDLELAKPGHAHEH
jgi:Spy/CpxP family protein refolding chaperone